MTKEEKKLMLSLLCKSKLFSPAVFYNNTGNNYFDVLVYASGKTASASIFESFKQYKKSCMHVHNTSYFLNKVLKQELYDSFNLFEYINCMNINKDILIIDVIREPVSRKISAFFQHLTRLPYINTHNLTRDELLSYYCENIQELIDLFNEKYFLQNENYYGFNEYKYDGLDIKKHHFDHDTNRMYIEHNHKRFLILRFDDISLWENIIKNLGYEDFELITANKTDEKHTAELYKIFKDNYTIPKSLLDKIYKRDHNILKIFYTEKELESHYNKWLSKSI